MNDKALHAGVGFILATILIFGAMFTYGFNMAIFEEYASKAIALTWLAGAGKEIYDYVSTRWFGQSHTVEVKDLWFTVMGAMPYFIIALLVKVVENPIVLQP